MATALYRRYRPESFAEVIGQDHVTTPLRRALRAGRVGHAYLFSGPRGCGKTTSARILARCLNCAEGPTDTPCGQCDSCRDLARGGPGSLDVVEIDAASHGGVDDARELRERATFAPARDRYKVFIIDEAHMVTSAGFNALLKLVEEPPEHVKFVFATTEPDKVIGTIRSRTHHYPFRLIPPQVLTPYLQEVCDVEGVAVGDGVLPLVVRAGGGSARDSLSVLDQLMAGAGENGLDYATAIALLGFTDTTLLDRAVQAIAQRDAAALYAVTEQVLATGHEPRRFVEDLLERLRDLIVLAAVPDRAEDLLPQIPAEDLAAMREQAAAIAPAELSLCGDLVHETLSTMSGATSPRLHLELLAARLVLRDERMSGGLARHGAAAPQSGGAPQEGAPARAGAPAGAGGSVPAGAGGAREEARRIAAERAEASRRARGGQTERPDRARMQRPEPQPEPAPREQQWQDDVRQQPGAPQQVRAPQQADVPRQMDGPQQFAPSSAELRPADQPRGEQARGEQPAPQGAAATEAAGAQGASAAPVREEAPAGAGGPGREDVLGHWSAILDELQKIRRASHVLIATNSQVLAVRGQTIVLGFRTEGLVTAFHRGTAAQNLADAVRRIMRADMNIEAVVGDDPGQGGGQSGGPGGPGGASGPGGPGGVSGPGGPMRGRPDTPNGSMGQNRPNGQAQAQEWGPQNRQERSASPEEGGRAAALAERMNRQAEQARERQDAEAHRAGASHSPSGTFTGGYDGPPPEDYPEPEDPYGDPPPPEEDIWGVRERQRPASSVAPRASASEGTRLHEAAGPNTARQSAPAKNEQKEPTPARVDGPPLEVQDEGRDSLPAGEPRTYGQAALRRAIADGRVVHSIPAGHGATAEESGPTPEAMPSTDSPAPSAQGTNEGAQTADTERDLEPGAPAQEQGPDLAEIEAVSADDSWGAVAKPPSAEPAAPLSGAALAREAAHASLEARRRQGNRFGRGQQNVQDASGPDDDDPTGGASRDDEDAEYTRRTGREVIETVLGGTVLEVIDETGR